MTVDELLALPDDGKERWLIGGELWEKEMTKRNRFHARLVARVCHLLEVWSQQQPEPRGEVVGGEAGFMLRRVLTADPHLPGYSCPVAEFFR